MMKVLIVESDTALSAIWQRHLERLGAEVVTATSQGSGVDRLQHERIDVIVLSLDISDGAALAVADFASYRQPDARVVFTTRRRFFSDGSVFRLNPNAAAFIPAQTRPEDLAEIVAHHGAAAR